jgi:predicted MFS family arabinose efflux permease
MTPGAALRIALAGLVAMGVGMGIGRFAFTPLLPVMREDAGLELAAGGYLAFANYLGYFTGSVIATRLRLRTDIAVLGSLIVIGAVTMAMAAVSAYPLWFLLRLIAGIANAWIAVYAVAWCLERLAPLQRPALNSLIFAGVGAGTMVIGALCALLILWPVGSRPQWVILGLCAWLMTATVWSTFRSAHRGELRHSAATGGVPLNRHTLLLIACFSIAGFGYIIPATFLPAMARDILNDPSLFVWAWPVFGVAAMLSTLAGGRLLRRYSARQLWIVCQFTMAAGVIVPALWNGLTVILLAALCVGGTFMVVTMLSLQEARAVAGEQVVPLIAAMTGAFAAGQMLGPLAASLMLEAGWGFAGGLFLAAGLLSVSGVMLWRWLPQRQRGGA